jgi:hypothetical protein
MTLDIDANATSKVITMAIQLAPPASTVVFG